jgi:hypothetical protein
VNVSRSREPYPWRSLGLWLAIVMALIQALYSVWAFIDPAALAAYRGAPLDDHTDTAWVHAYGSRTLFIASVVALLVVKGDFINLRWAALFALVMVVSDALTALRADLPPSVLYRHIGTGMYLLITFAVLTRRLRITNTKCV